MIVATALFAVLQTSAPAPACGDLDLQVPVGLGLEGRADGDGFDAAAYLGLSAGLPLSVCLGVPLRLELSLATGTAGPPWGAGVDAVEVARQDVDLAALTGVAYVFVKEGDKGLGVEALAGPRLRLTRVRTRIYAQSESRYGATVRAAALVGPFATYKAWRVSLRPGASLPWDRRVQLWLGIGRSL